MSSQANERKALKITRIGKVSSDKRDKSRKVVVTFTQQVPKYGKYIQRQSVYQVHDEANASKAGDMVEIAPCRPISKTKSWRLVRVLDKNGQPLAGA